MALATPPMVFGLVSADASAEGDASASFEQLAAWLREHAELELSRKTAASYKDLMASVREGSTDVAWIPPVVYAWLAEAVDPVGCIVRGGKTSYSAALTVLPDSTIAAVDDLHGAKAGWVDPWSAAGYVVPRIELMRAGFDPRRFVSEKFYGSHAAALRALRRRDCDVVCTFDGAWLQAPALEVRVLETYGPIPTDVIAVRRNLPAASYEQVRSAFRAACADQAARPLVRAVFGGDELREGALEGHEALRIRYDGALAQGLFD